jgi:hypothetical protein
VPVIASKPVARISASSVCAPAASHQAGGGEALDRRRRQIDQAHVRPVEGGVVAGVHAQPLAADGVVGHSAAAVAGSLTMPRILLRTNSPASSLAAGLTIRSLKVPSRPKPPICQRSSNGRSRSSADTENAEKPLGGSIEPKPPIILRLRSRKAG